MCYSDYWKQTALKTCLIFTGFHKSKDEKSIKADNLQGKGIQGSCCCLKKKAEKTIRDKNMVSALSTIIP